MTFILIFLIILSQPSVILAQLIPKSNFINQTKKICYDAGIEWESLTFFSPIRFHSKLQSEQSNFLSSTQINSQIGLTARNDSYSLHGFGRIRYKNNYYAYTYPIFVKKYVPNQYLKQKTKFVNQYESSSGLGFENSWAIMQICRGNESWAAGNDIELALSHDSGTYDYLLLGLGKYHY